MQGLSQGTQEIVDWCRPAGKGARVDGRLEAAYRQITKGTAAEDLRLINLATYESSRHGPRVRVEGSGMAYHEVRLEAGDPAEGPVGQVIVYVDDNGQAYYPGSEGYLEPEEGNREFLMDQGAQLAEDQTAVATGQDRQFSPEQRENTMREAGRITDPSHPRYGQEQQDLSSGGGVVSQGPEPGQVPDQQGMQQDPNAQQQAPNAPATQGQQDQQGDYQVQAGMQDPNAEVVRGAGQQVEGEQQSPPQPPQQDPNAPQQAPPQPPAQPPAQDPNQQSQQ